MWPTKRIEKLTREQEELLPRFRQDWLNWGTNTDRAERAGTERAILALRKHLGIDKTPVFIWCESPATCVLALGFLCSEALEKRTQDIMIGQVVPLGPLLWSSLRNSLEASLEASLEPSLMTSLRNSLEASGRSSLWSSLGFSLEASLNASLEASLMTSLGPSLEASLRTSLEASLGTSRGFSLEASLRTSLWASLDGHWWGQHESYWISFYVFCRDVLGVKYEEESSRLLDNWRTLAQSCGWWWCYENYVICSERTTSCKMEPISGQDFRFRLHSATGPALEFSDGWAVYSWHGIRVPQRLIEEPGSITAEEILTQGNVEIRRVMIEIFGLERLLRKSNTGKIDSSPIGTLYRLDIIGDEPITMVEVACPSTARRYMLRVPPNTKTALEATAWTFGLNKEAYQPTIET